jgi:hypothetical protein
MAMLREGVKVMTICKLALKIYKSGSRGQGLELVTLENVGAAAV